MINCNTDIEEQGFCITKQLYSESEVESISELVENYSIRGSEVKKTDSLYSIRNLLNNAPSLKKELFSEGLKNLVSSFGDGYRVIKSIYFDKPPLSNWFVPNHQDLTINVKEKKETDGFINWVKKDGFYSVQPPLEYLENIITVRIHLDDTSENNGALIVKPKSHKNGVVRNDNLLLDEEDFICDVKKGSAMLMKPLLFHKSLKTTNDKRRRVIHLELSNIKLPQDLIFVELYQI